MAVAPLLAIVGTAVSAAGTVYGAVSGAAGARAEAQSMNIKAKQERAAGERQANERRREAALVQSRQRAVAAASGGGASDPSVLRLMSGVAERGELNAQTEMFNADSAATSLQNQAAALRANASQQMVAGLIGAGSTMLSGASDFMTKYRTTPSSTSSTPSYLTA